MKDQIVTEEHHRRPRSLGGKTHESNISYVKSKLHKHYHTLFGNKNALQICEWLNKDCQYKPDNVKIICKFINGSRVQKSGSNCSKKQRKINFAWRALMNGLTFAESIEYLNNVWIDPSYHFYLKET